MIYSIETTKKSKANVTHSLIPEEDWGVIEREEKNRKQRDYRLLNGNECTRRYEKTKKGSLMRTYRNMKSRVEGVLKHKAHLYEGKEILPKSDFYSWAMNNVTFHTLFSSWISSGYDKKYTPSIDRIDSSLGYVAGNMQWLTHSEKSSKGAISKHNKGESYE